MVVEYKPLFIETDEERHRDRLIPTWQAVAPFPIVEDAVPAFARLPAPEFARFHKLLPDVRSLASSIVEDDFDYTKALVVESSVDQLVDWAPNVLVFVADPRFIGIKPYAKQAEMLVRLFEEWCPRCSNPDWFIHGFPTAATFEEVEKNCAMLEFGTCPHCKYTKKDGRLSNVFNDPDELIAVIGQRAGKSAVTSMGVSYLTHINCMLHTPWKTYGLTPGQVIDFTMVAVTVGQSEKALWSNFKQMLSQSYWFRKYKEVCDDYGQKHGIAETIRVNETFFKFRHKGIELHNASNNNKALRGATRFGFAIDELAFFDDDAKSGKTRGNGAETYTSLNNSLASLRQKAADVVAARPGSTIPNSLGFCVSSPRAMNDAIMQLYRDRKSDKKAVAMHLPTWDMNPNFPRNSKVVAGMLKQANGWRDFGARPPLTDNPLVSKGGIVEDAFKSALATDPTYGLILSPSVMANQDEFRIVNGRNVQTTAIAVIDEEYVPPKPKAISPKALAALGPHRALYEELLAKPASLRPHVLGIDMGTSNNSFALVASYLSDDGLLITDFAVEIKGTSRIRVNIAHIFDNVIVPLIEKLNIVGVFYDQWNSLHHIQALTNLKGALGPLNSSQEVRKWKNDLRKEGELPPFIADQVRLTMADANLLVARLEQGDILFPKMERPMFDLVQDSRLEKNLTPFTHLALQFSTVRVSANGSQLRKPADNGEDDIFRAWAVGAIMAFTDETVMALLKGASKKDVETKSDSAPLGYVSVGNAGRGVRRIPPGTTGSTSLVVRRTGNAGGGFGFGGKR